MYLRESKGPSCAVVLLLFACLAFVTHDTALRISTRRRCAARRRSFRPRRNTRAGPASMSAARSGSSSAEMNFAGATAATDRATCCATTALENEQHPSRMGRAWQGQSLGHELRRLSSATTPSSDDVIVGIDVHYNRSSFAAQRAGDADHPRRHRRRQHLRRDRRRRRVDAHHRLWRGARCAPAGSSATSCPYATLGFAVGRADITRSAQRLRRRRTVGRYPRACDPGRVPVRLLRQRSRRTAPSSMAGRPAAASTCC